MKTPETLGKTFADFPIHHRILTNVLALLSADERVKGIYLSGSFAHGVPDKFSDLDFYILVPDAQLEQIVQAHSPQLAQVSSIVSQFPATHLNDPNMLIVIYEARRVCPFMWISTIRLSEN